MNEEEIMFSLAEENEEKMMRSEMNYQKELEKKRSQAKNSLAKMEEVKD